MKKLKTIIIAILALLLGACAAVETQPQGANVQVSNNPPPQGCKYLGQVVGNQGNFFTGAFTSNENMAAGSLNDIKNKAGQLGANYVQLITSQASSTASMSQGSGQMMQTNVANTGNAYHCPPASIGE